MPAQIKIAALIMASNLTNITKDKAANLRSPFLRRDQGTNNDYMNLPVGGRLSRFSKEWQKSTFWKIIKYGLTWKWRTTPPLVVTTKSWHQQTSPDMDKEVIKMYRKRVIEKTRFLKFRSRLFSVPKRDSLETRTILDLSKLTRLSNSTFKMLTRDSDHT